MKTPDELFRELAAAEAEVTALSNAGNAELAAYQAENARLKEANLQMEETLTGIAEVIGFENDDGCDARKHGRLVERVSEVFDRSVQRGTDLWAAGEENARLREELAKALESLSAEKAESEALQVSVESYSEARDAAVMLLRDSEARLSTAKALAMEEAAQKFGAWMAEGWRLSLALQALRALAPLPPGLVAMRVERVAEVKKAHLALLDSFGEYARQTMYSNPEWDAGFRRFDAAIAILDRSAR